MTTSSTPPFIIHETRYWIAVNKPVGIVVEGTKEGSPTIQSHLLDYLTQKKKKAYLGIVHRLDRVTSGILLMAKNKNTLRSLNKQFQERQVQKIYYAIVERPPIPKEGKLRHFLYKDTEQRKAILAPHPTSNTKECKLIYEHISSSHRGHHLLKINLLTGKYHQIRAQLSSINTPIIGDEKYGSQINYQKQAIALHAWQLRFTDPIEKKLLKLTAMPPDNLFWKDFRAHF